MREALESTAPALLIDLGDRVSGTPRGARSLQAAVASVRKCLRTALRGQRRPDTEANKRPCWLSLGFIGTGRVAASFSTDGSVEGVLSAEALGWLEAPWPKFPSLPPSSVINHSTDSRCPATSFGVGPSERIPSEVTGAAHRDHGALRPSQARGKRALEPSRHRRRH